MSKHKTASAGLPPDSQRGFSIVEILVSMALLSLVGYFLYSTQSKSQKSMFQGVSRDAHLQVVGVIKSRTSKVLAQVLGASHTQPASIEAVWGNDINLGDGLHLNWIKTPVIPFVAQPNPVAREALEICQKSRTLPKSWEGNALKARLGSGQMSFCGQLIKPKGVSAEVDAQNLARAQAGFLLLTVTFTKVMDGAPITLAQYTGDGKIATVTWTLVWSYQKGQETVQQSRKGIYHIVP